MKLLRNPIKDLSFDDIGNFCAEKQTEGIQIEYKQDFPKKGLATSMAALSNTRGGIIIVGVEEDSASGTPLKWEGIVNDGKIHERINQYASNIEPLPSYDIATTDEKNGKVFVLIRVYEGDRTPYYVHNDSNLWVRTGNIRHPIEIASPEHAELLYRKRERAELARKVNLQNANDIFSHSLMKAEQQRVQQINVESKKEQKDRRTIYPFKLGSQASMCTMALQPFCPAKALTPPFGLKDIAREIRSERGFYPAFPSINNFDSIPEGILRFDWNDINGTIVCEQLYANGLVVYANDVLQVDAEQHKQINLINLAGLLYRFLDATKNYYNKVGYQGNLIGEIKLEKVGFADIISMTSSDFFYSSNQMQSGILPTYEWQLDTDTLELNERDSFLSLYKEKVSEIHWSFGYEPPPSNLVDNFLKTNGLSAN